MTRKAKNELTDLVPYGLIATKTWLMAEGTERHRVDNWLKSGQLVPVARGVFSRPDTKNLTWQGVVCSLQRMRKALAPGGLTALELHGMAHYLPMSQDKTIHLYGTDHLPPWTQKILRQTRFVRHSRRQLFGAASLKNDVNYDTRKDSHADGDPLQEFSAAFAWTLEEWPLTISTPERAIFEILLDVPKRTTFEHADQLMQGMVSLSPRRLNRLLGFCSNIKVKRLFLWLAERHHHPWLKKLDMERFSMTSGMLGSGKRVLAKGGKLDPKYLITVPENLYGQE